MKTLIMTKYSILILMALKCKREFLTIDQLGILVKIMLIQMKMLLLIIIQLTLPFPWKTLNLRELSQLWMEDPNQDLLLTQEAFNSCNIEEFQLMTGEVWERILTKLMNLVMESKFQLHITFKSLTRRKLLHIKDKCNWNMSHLNKPSLTLVNSKKLHTNSSTKLILEVVDLIKTQSRWFYFQ